MIKKWADKLFEWYCHPDYYPDIKGDLEELYSRNTEAAVNLRDWRYLVDIVLLFRPSLVRSVIINSIINTAMFQNYLKVSIRNLMRQKFFASINIVGLAIGLTGFLLINEYVKFESSYDAGFKEADQLYRVSTIGVDQGSIEVKDAMASHALGNLLQAELPEVQNHTVTKKFDELVLKNGNVAYSETSAISADSNFLKLFDYRLIKGNEESLFNEPLSIVLSESKAKTYFGDEDPIGKTLKVLSPYKVSLKVTGIIQDIPINTHYYFDVMISDKTLVEEDDYNNWNYDNYYVYIKTPQNFNQGDFNGKLKTLAKKQYGEDTDSYWNAHKVKNIYLESDFTFEPQLQGSKNAVSFLAIISIFILVIAWVNYVNLSTARALDRAKEVGLRKVVGAFKYQLFAQFLFESLLINTLGALLALVLSELSLNYFNNLVGKEIITHVWNHLPYLLNLLIFTIVGTFVSGFYPALVLSGFKPISILKGKYSNSKAGIFMRKGLVVVQFAASLMLIAATFIVNSQVQYMKGKDKGMVTDYVVSVTVPSANAETREEFEAFVNHFNSFKESLRSFSAIEGVGGTSNLPGGGGSDINSTNTKLSIPAYEASFDGTTYVQYNDDQFVDAMNMKLLAGRSFKRSFEADSNAAMVNVSFLKRMNITDYDGVIGKELKLGDGNDPRRQKIVGVIADFHRTSLKEVVEPTLFLPWFNARALVVKLQGDRYKDALAFMEEQWNQYYPDNPFESTFLDERFAALYDQDERFGNVFAVFAAFAILVATLGLFGLASFLSIQRAKEVGIRKVLGASVANIIGIFYRDFIILLCISTLIGVPAIYWGMTSWLNNYAYRIGFPWWLTALAILVVVAFALLTVGYQTYKVAVADPSRTLKDE